MGKLKQSKRYRFEINKEIISTPSNNLYQTYQICHLLKSSPPFYFYFIFMSKPQNIKPTWVSWFGTQIYSPGLCIWGGYTLFPFCYIYTSILKLTTEGGMQYVLQCTTVLCIHQAVREVNGLKPSPTLIFTSVNFFKTRIELHCCQFLRFEA